MHMKPCWSPFGRVVSLFTICPGPREQALYPRAADLPTLNLFGMRLEAQVLATEWRDSCDRYDHTPLSTAPTT